MDPCASSFAPPPFEDDPMEARFADPKPVFAMRDEDVTMAAAPLGVPLRFADRPDRREERLAVVRWLLALKLRHHACGGEGFASADEVAACVARLRRDGPARVPRYMAAKPAPLLEAS